MAPYTVHKVDWSQDADACRRVRERVFIEEQGISRELEWDGLDEDSVHFLAVYEGAGMREVVGTCRLLPTGQIGRMAVLPEHRGTHTGRLLLDAAMLAARERGHYRVFLHAQLTVEGFYAKAGFRPIGETFIEAGIAHIEMERELPLTFESSTGPISAPVTRPPHFVDAGDARAPAVTRITSTPQLREVVLASVRGARRSLLIFSRDLNRAVFDDAEFESALSAFCRTHSRALAHIIVIDSSDAARSHHRLVELTRRLTTAMAIRKAGKLGDDGEESPELLLIADDRTFVLIPAGDTKSGFIAEDDPAGVKKWASYFTQQWTYAREDANLRHLKL